MWRGNGIFENNWRKKNTFTQENWSKSLCSIDEVRKEVSEKSIETAENEDDILVQRTAKEEWTDMPTLCALRFATQKWFEILEREDIRSLLRGLSFVLRCRCREKSI